MRWVAPRGLDVELIRLDGHAVFRARQHRVLIRYCRTVADLEDVLAAARLTAADLVEVLPSRRA